MTYCVYCYLYRTADTSPGPIVVSICILVIVYSQFYCVHITLLFSFVCGPQSLLSKLHQILFSQFLPTCDQCLHDIVFVH